MSSRTFERSIFVLALSILGVGILWSYTRSGRDFYVFHFIFNLVAQGRALEIYDLQITPDRYLYAPGLAWIFAPLGYLKFSTALTVWNFLKVLLLGVTVRLWLKKGRVTLLSWSLGILFCAKPVLIDFQYGQINLLLFCIALIFSFFYFAAVEEGPQPALETSRRARLSFWVAFLSTPLLIAKVYSAVFLLLPFLPIRNRNLLKSARILQLRWGVVMGSLALILIPWVSLNGDHFGLAQWLSLHEQWLNALQLRGLPIESHNQSFMAFLRHYFSGEATPVFFLSMTPQNFSLLILEKKTLFIAAILWAALWFGFQAHLIWIREKIKPSEFTALLISSCFLPSHLIWKPYFALGLMSAALLIASAKLKREKLAWLLLGLVLNFSGYDFVGPRWGAILESGSLLLYCHSVAIGWLYWKAREGARSRTGQVFS